MLKWMLGLWIIWNIGAFFLMGADKRKARHGKRRIPEARLFLTALVGGAAGIYLGMKVFRHKTRHRSFRFGIPPLIFLHVSAWLLIVWLKYGKSAFFI